jgi:dihydrofolate synthase/folylpolyglutamate synthase
VSPAGIAEARWPGRLEHVAPNPDIILDGAHNPAGARALARYLEQFYLQPGSLPIGGRRLWLVYGAMRDKALDEIAGILFPLAHELIFTAPAAPRALRPEALAAIAGRGRPVADVGQAIALARGQASTDDVIVITGSLFLVGEARAHFVQ